MQKQSNTLKQTTQQRQAHQAVDTVTRLTPMQMELLDIFAHKELSSQEILELKDILSNYFLDKAQSELDTLAQENDWDLAEKANEWGKEKLRTPYRRDHST